MRQFRGALPLIVSGVLHLSATEKFREYGEQQSFVSLVVHYSYRFKTVKQVQLELAPNLRVRVQPAMPSRDFRLNGTIPV